MKENVLQLSCPCNTSLSHSLKYSLLKMSREAFPQCVLIVWSDTNPLMVVSGIKNLNVEIGNLVAVDLFAF